MSLQVGINIFKKRMYQVEKLGLIEKKYLHFKISNSKLK